MVLICVECNSSFETSYKQRRVCSDKCRRDRANRLGREKNGLEVQRYICSICRKSFQPIRANQVRCSKKCSRLHDSWRTNQYNKQHRNQRADYDQEYRHRPSVKRRKSERERGYYRRPATRRRIQLYAQSDRGRVLHRRIQGIRRARKKSVFVSREIPTVVSLLVEQGGKCANCGVKPQRQVHVDHIMPLALGGSHEERNLQALCQSCNQRKHAKHPLDFAREEGRLL